MASYIRPEIRDEVLRLYGLTIDRIAEAANLSPDTVKLAFQRRGRREEETDRIAKVIQEAGYPLNRKTDILKSSRSATGPSPDQAPDSPRTTLPRAASRR